MVFAFSGYQTHMFNCQLEISMGMAYGYPKLKPHRESSIPSSPDKSALPTCQLELPPGFPDSGTGRGLPLPTAQFLTLQPVLQILSISHTCLLVFLCPLTTLISVSLPLRWRTRVPLMFSLPASLAFINSVILHGSRRDSLKIRIGYVISLLRILCWLNVTLRIMFPMCFIIFKVLPDGLWCLPVQPHLSPLSSNFCSPGILPVSQRFECTELFPTSYFSYIWLSLSRALHPHHMTHFFFLRVSSVYAYVVTCVIIFKCQLCPQNFKFPKSKACVSLAHQIAEWQE